jgi:protein-S-isoprenylcysteine O-methyltransferase Ste14
MHRTQAGAPVLPAALVVVGVLIALGAQFLLDSLADTSDTWHWIQHGVTFAGGVTAGAAMMALYAASRPRG